MLPSDASSAAPTRNFEYGAYARSIAAKARSRIVVMVRSSPARSRPVRCSAGIPVRYDLRKEGRAAAAERDAQPLADCRPEIRERRPTPDVDGPHATADGEQRNALAGMV